MQEFLLFGQIPAESHRTLRQQLTGITRMQPQPVLERHVIFRPVPPAGLSNLPSGSGAPGAQQQELQKTRQLLNAPLNYVQLVGIVEKKDVVPPGERQEDQQIGAKDQDAIMIDSKNDSDESSKELQWYLEFRDIPEPGKVTTTSRAMSKTRILDGDPVHFMTDLGYEYFSQYVLTGDKFYDQDTTLFVHSVLQVPEQAPQDTKVTFPTINTVPDHSKLTPLDPSGGFVLQASIEIADSNSTELKEKALQQILAIKETLRASVNLLPGDRLALDTRVPVKRVR